MKKIILYIWMISPVYAQDSFSLFLSQEEQSLAAENFKSNAAAEKITLSAIMYSDANNWAFWLNNLKVTPDEIPAHIKVIHVDPQSVKMTYGNKTITVKLQEVINASGKP